MAVRHFPHIWTSAALITDFCVHNLLIPDRRCQTLVSLSFVKMAMKVKYIFVWS